MVVNVTIACWNDRSECNSYILVVHIFEHSSTYHLADEKGGYFVLGSVAQLVKAQVV